MGKKNLANYGCLFFSATILAQGLLFVCYRIAHWKYSYTRPGGHHFGGADLAVFEAFTYALILGPLFGIGLTLLMTLQINEFRKRKGRVIVGLILICIPIVRFTFDVISYR